MTAVAGMTFWVGSSGSATGFGMLRSIRDRWGDAVRLVALDTGPPELNASSVVADSYMRVPPVAAADYAETLERFLQRVHAPTVYIPIYDSEILAAASRAEAGGLPSSLRILVAGCARSIANCNDKYLAYQTLTAAGLPAACTMLPDAVRSPGEPFVMKPRYGVASSVALITSQAEFVSHRSGADATEFVVQELCDEPEITIDAFIGRAGGPNAGIVCAIARERLQTKAGVATKCRLFHDGRLADLSRQIAGAFQLSGSFCFQVMPSRTDRGWRVTDVNPRSGGGTRMSAAIGSDFMAANVADFLEEPVGDLLRPRSLPQFVVRQHAEYVTTPT